MSCLTDHAAAAISLLQVSQSHAHINSSCTILSLRDAIVDGWDFGLEPGTEGHIMTL